MVFGLTQWLISFVIFLIVLTVITWSAVHLSKKDHNSTDINLRFFDVDDHSIQRENSTSRVIESTDDPTLFTDDQGSEIPDSAEFYNFVVKTFSFKNSTASIRDDTATTIFTSSVIDDTIWSEDDAIKIFISPIVKNDTTWSEDTSITIFTSPAVNNAIKWKKEDITIYNASDKSLLLLNDHRNISEKL